MSGFTLPVKTTAAATTRLFQVLAGFGVFLFFFFFFKKKSRCNLSDPLFVSLSVVLEGDRDVCVCVSERERVNVCVLSKTKVEHWKKNECKRFEALIFELSV